MHRKTTWIVGVGSVLLFAAVAQAAEQESFRVGEVQAGQPFSCTMELRETTPAYRVYRLSFPSPVVTATEANNTVPVDYYLPTSAMGGEKGGVKSAIVRRPAVICLHILHGNFELERITCSMLASHGIPAAMMKLPYYGERAPAEGTRALVRDPKLFLEALPQGIADVRRIVDVLTARPEVDPKAIGVIGISLGGIVAATAAEAEPRLSRAALILAGGDLNTIVQHARETKELSRILGEMPAEQRAAVDKAVRAIDPLTQAERLRERAMAGRVLMVNASQDEVIPPACTKQLAAALGISDKVVWLEGLGHYTAIASLPRVLNMAAEFFGQDMPAALKQEKPVQPVASGPMQVLLSVLRQGVAIVSTEPAEGRAHLAALEGRIQRGNDKPLDVQLRFIRGHAQRFRVEASVSGLGQLAIGQGDYCWMATPETVFRGTLGDRKPLDNPLPGVEAEKVEKLKSYVAAVGAMTLAPQVLEQVLSVSEVQDPDGPALELRTKSGRNESATLVLQADRKTPKSIRVAARDASGKIQIRQWQTDAIAVDGLFAEPQGRQIKEVEAADLQRMFAAVFNFALERLP